MPRATAQDIGLSTSFETTDLDDLENPAVRLGVTCWLQLRGERRFPARDEMQPREIAGALRHMLLVKVLDGGADYEYRIVGDAQVRAYTVTLQNRRFSQVAADAPVLGKAVGQMFDRVVKEGEPIAARGRVGRDIPEANFTDSEFAILPLGTDRDGVDHLVVFASYAMRGVATYSM
jgi:hypothetical protein